MPSKVFAITRQTVNLIRLKQTNTLDDEHNERTEEAIKRAEKDFALDLPMLVEETARDVKILSPFTAIERNQIEEIFYPYRPHRHHLTTRFGLLFCNDKIVIPEAMPSTVTAMLHQGHPSASKMDQSAAAFCWPGLYREIREKAENCPSCRASGKNLTTQLPSTEKNNLEILSEPKQESCFKSNDFNEFCNQENIKRIRCSPNLHTGTGQMERTIRTIKSLTRANMADGLTFGESVNLAIKKIRQNPHSKLNMTQFQMHFRRKPRTAITNLIGRPECPLSDWKKSLTNYLIAQPTELQMFTINASEGEMATIWSLTTRSVSREFKQYQFFEKENKRNAMKCRFKTN